MVIQQQHSCPGSPSPPNINRLRALIIFDIHFYRINTLSIQVSFLSNHIKMMSLVNALSIALVALSSLVQAAPLTYPLEQRQAPDPSCVNGIKRTYVPDMFNIYYYPDVPSFPSTSKILNVMNGSETRSAQDQIARWANLPNNAKNCTIGYHQNADRSFSVYNNGLIRFSQLSGLPPAGTNVTAETIGPFQVPNAKTGSMDFTYWPELPGVFDHIGGPVDCGAEIFIKLTKDMVNGGPGSVTMEQNDGNGLWLQHSC